MPETPERRTPSAEPSTPMDKTSATKGVVGQFWSSGPATARIGPRPGSPPGRPAASQPSSTREPSSSADGLALPSLHSFAAPPFAEPGFAAPVAADLTVNKAAFLTGSQREATATIQRILAERHVFAAFTGAPGSGKTLVLSTAIATQLGPPARIIRVNKPSQVPAEQAMEIARSILDQAPSPEGLPHTVVVVDDAHAASPELLRCLVHVAEFGRSSPGSSQVILVGRPELWDRLKADEFAPLVDRIAVRPVLQPMTDEDARGLIKHLLDQPRTIFGQALSEAAEQEALRLSGGLPERVGAMVRSALTLGDVQTRPQISVEMVRSAAAMLDGAQPRPVGTGRARVVSRGLAAAMGALVVVGLAAVATGWPTDRMQSYARGTAESALAWLTQAADGTAHRLAEATQQKPEMRQGIDVPTKPVTGSPQMEVAQVDEGRQQPQPAPVTPEAHAQPDAAAAADQAPETAGAGTPLPTAAAAAVAPPAAAAPESRPAPTEPVAAGPNAAAASRPASGNSPAPLAPGVVAVLLRRGDEVLALGDISTARHFYERTIAAGSASGARGVARTYDPAVLGRTNPAANPAAAAAWYDMAAALDDVEASGRRAAAKGVR